MSLAALPLVRESKSAQFLRFWNVKPPQKNISCSRPEQVRSARLCRPLVAAPRSAFNLRTWTKNTFLSRILFGSVQDWLFLLAVCLSVLSLEL